MTLAPPAGDLIMSPLMRLVIISPSSSCCWCVSTYFDDFFASANSNLLTDFLCIIFGCNTVSIRFEKQISKLYSSYSVVKIKPVLTVLLGLWSSQLSADCERRCALRFATGTPSRFNGGAIARVGSAGDRKRLLYWWCTFEFIAVDVVILYADGNDGGNGGILLLLFGKRPIVCVAVVIRLERNVVVTGAVEVDATIGCSTCFFFSTKLAKLVAWNYHQSRLIELDKAIFRYDYFVNVVFGEHSLIFF